MELLGYIRKRDRRTAFGYSLFVEMMAAGYYNLTFVQLGPHDLGTRVIGMREGALATNIAYLALITCATVLLFGALITKLGCFS